MRRRRLLEIFHAGLEAADGRAAVASALATEPRPRRVDLIAVGKCAPVMTRGAMDVWGETLRAGILVAPRGALDTTGAPDGRISVFEASHPVPDASSLEAGRALTDFLAASPGDAFLLFLLSGGASSLVERPVAGVDLAALRQANEWLLRSGLDIAAVNAVRRRLSRIKGGGLARLAAGREALALCVSDVEGDSPADIGSGLLCVPAAGTLPPMPEWLREMTVAAPVPAPVPAVRHRVVASLRTALAGCRRQAEVLGLAVRVVPDYLAGDARGVAGRVAAELDRVGEGVCLMGGETTVCLPPRPGRGGRNQHLALAVALQIEGRADLAVLCAGTDGRDGPTEDAGALVDGGTILRGRDAGLDPRRCLDAADSGSFLEAAGDLVYTGHTGTNVNDLVIGWKRAPDGGA